ncbi:hypothetical protein [Streptomyces scabiei]|uniref:hypothetical protein n=1 Tax=Streptomyces scabiei TaxID=1930 RepID=UPI0018FE29A0|nr:hypothetical protein [Streptomyces scabiei]
MSRSSWVEEPSTIGSRRGRISPRIVNDFSIGAIVNFAVASEKATYSFFSVCQPTAACCVAFGIEASAAVV